MSELKVENRVFLRGTICTDPTMSPASQPEEGYLFSVSTKRKSGVEDCPNIFVPLDVFRASPLAKGDRVQIEGKIRVYANNDPNAYEGTKMVVQVIPNTITATDRPSDRNYYCVSGYISRVSEIYTTHSKKSVLDILLTLADTSSGTARIPLIAWGTVAFKYANAERGRPITASGRLQTREFRKKINEDGDFVIRRTQEFTIFEAFDSEQGEKEEQEEKEA